MVLFLLLLIVAVVLGGAQHHIVRPAEGPPARHPETPAALRFQPAQQHAAAQGEQSKA
ncbi:hypothetical protein [Streptomyces sp. TE5632]